MESYQHKIAEMALEVCQIKHGGNSTGFYTLTNFADDIGINRKTLSGWVAIYRDILLKCRINTPTQKDWSDASKVERVLKSEGRIENKKKGAPRAKNAYVKNMDEKVVLELFEKFQKEDEDEEYELGKILSSSRHNNFKLKELDLYACDQAKISELLEILNESISLLGKSKKFNKKHA
jgi:hypothetical protein